MAFTTLDPRFFDLADVRPAQGRSWIPLRQQQDQDHDSPFPGIGGLREYAGIATLAVSVGNRDEVDSLGWSEIDVSTHRPSLEDGIYRPADVHCDWSPERKVIGTRLVMAQFTGSFAPEIWHLHPDLILALKLQREGDRWFRPDEGWVEVVRLRRKEEGHPILLEMRAEMLSDYLAARNMALFLSSYHERSAYFEERPGYEWAADHLETTSGRDSREKYITGADFPPSPSYRFRGLGALWRTEWFEPGSLSIRVRGDQEPSDVTFAVGTDGGRKTAQACVSAQTYLAFQPTLVPTLLRFRGGSLGWYTRDTGAIGAAEHGIHFGVNSLGLITIFAKDIANLDVWEQRTWAAHSTVMDGGVSRELFDAQMQCNPARTQAPEAQIGAAIDELNERFKKRFGAPLLRESEAVEELIRRAHRFRAVEEDGLLALSKELSRLLMERVDVDVLRGPGKIPPKERIGSLKALERMLTEILDLEQAREMMAPLFGIYDLRNADAHLGSSLVESGLARAKVDREHASPVEQGCQLLEMFVKTVRQIGAVIEPQA